MAAFVSISAVAKGTSSLSVAYPAPSGGSGAGDMLLLCIANKYPAATPTLPAGWSLPTNGQQSGGHGASGVDTGLALCTVFTKEADGSEAGSLSVTITGGNSAIGFMVRYEKAAANTWVTPGSRSIANNTPSTSWNVTTGGNPALVAGDLEIAVSAINTDGNNPWSAEALACAGVTFDTVFERGDDSTANGDDCGILICDAGVLSGTSSAGIQLTMSGNGLPTGDAPCGATVFIKLREQVPLVNPPANTLETADWDRQDDWLYEKSTPGWDRSQLGADFRLERLATPSPAWIGGCGRFRSAWSSGVGTANVTTKPLALTTPGRKMRASWAMLWKDNYVNFSGARVGPVRIIARNDAGGSLSEAFLLSIVTSGASPATGKADLYAYNSLSATLSTNHIDLNRFVNEWLVFDLAVESTGSAFPYTTTFYCDVYVWRSGRLKFLSRLALPDYSGTPFDFSEWRLGFLGLSKNVDNFELYIDELRIDTGGASVPLPRDPAGQRSYQAYARIRKWDKVTSTWGSAWDIDAHAVHSLTCSFLAYRVEDSCEIQLSDPGRYSASKLQDVLADLEQNPKALYRLDVYAPDTSYCDPQFPSAWRDDVIFWSGVIERREPKREAADRGITLSAVGWTAHLSRIMVTKKAYHKRTLNYMLADVLASIQSKWPGTIGAVTRANGLDQRLVLKEAAWDGIGLDQVLEDLAGFGQFFFGVSVCGYPSFDLSSGNEFRLVFLEPAAENDSAVPSSAGLGEECGIFVSVDDDQRIVSLDHSIDEGRYANRWLVNGDELYFNFLSAIYIQTGQYALDAFAMVASDGNSGMELFQSLTGMQLAILDKAFRSRNYIDPATNTRYSAGFVGPLPRSLQRVDGDTSFLILSATDVGAGGANPYVLFDLGEVPLDDQSATLLTQALRYTVRANGTKLQRLLGDYEDSGSGATGREEVTRRIDESEVRGWQAAGVLAMQDRYAERLTSEQVKLRMKAWRRVPNGSRWQHHNLVALTLGGEKTTLIGTTAQGGDNWKYGDDERPVGGARTFEIKSVTMTLEDGGWDAEWSLGASARDLKSILLPSSVEFRALPAIGT